MLSMIIIRSSGSSIMFRMRQSAGPRSLLLVVVVVVVVLDACGAS